MNGDVMEAAPKADGGNTAAMAQKMYPSMVEKPQAPVKALPTDTELAAQKMYPSMFEKPVEPAKAVAEQSKAVAEPAQATPEATAFAEVLAQQYEGIVDAGDPSTIAFAGIAQELGLDAKAAGRLVEWDQDRSQRYWDGISAGYVQTVKSHPEWQSRVDGAKAVLRHYATDELKEELKSDPALGNHPGLIGLLSSIHAHLAKAGIKLK